MKILFDEDVPQKLVRFLPLHEIHTVVSIQCGGVKNGELLARIEGEAFDIFLTGDKNTQNQQRLDGRPFAVLVLSAINLPVIEPHIQTIALAIGAAKRSTVQMIDCGEFVRRVRDNE